MRIAGRSHRVVPGTDRRRTKDPSPARLPAVTIELRCVVDDDVVGVEAGEPCACRETHEGGLPEEPQPHGLSRDALPLLRREVHGAVDIDVTYSEAADVDEVGCNRVDRPTHVWLDLDADLQAASLGCAHDSRQALILL